MGKVEGVGKGMRSELGRVLGSRKRLRCEGDGVGGVWSSPGTVIVMWAHVRQVPGGERLFWPRNPKQEPRMSQGCMWRASLV